ncbi:outer membrane beta-barrel protein [Maribacter sp. ACAM166]|uniref:outer membrane beta-barrel protein n=1 Tax=Maribacter sp. ACAM166 TaxID=2508996 RepID=UPI0010FD7DEE|nr:outer membrane beta-barrel protein [Maribacter sp. ACAM166]TLP80802.1 PorT family protein [Maribacter sp. ACAM166]
MHKNKLDELFQEKFLDFKQAPENKVWRAIDASLEKKKKKRIIPIWWTLCGIAAALAITFLLFNPFSDTQTTNEILVDTQKDVEQTNDFQSTSTKEQLIDSLNIGNDPLVQKGAEETIKSIEDHQSEGKNQEESTKLNPNEPLISKGNWSQNKNALAKNERNKTETITENTALAESDSTKNTMGDLIPNDANVTTESLNSASVSPTKAMNTNKQDSIGLDAETTLVANATLEKNQEVSEEGRKSIFEEIVDQEEEINIASTHNRWSAGPNIAPVYFNADGKGSPINSIFVTNSKSGNINLSYGVSVAYAVSKKLSIRSGISKVDYGYDTEDVSFSSSLNSFSNNGQLATIDYVSTSNTLTVSSKKVTSEVFSTANKSLDVSAKSATRDGYMSQQFRYLELPVEINYALIDKKFGVNLIGGLSSLFLIDNSVSLTAGELTTEIGEANNVNDLNFSANMGLGFNYKFSPKVRFNIEPIFKYQLNTFSEVDGTFRPYSIGVYSGLSFKF